MTNPSATQPRAPRLVAWLAAALVAAGGITALVALTVEGADLPSGSGGAWARATFAAAGDDGDPDPEATLVVVLTVRGDAAVLPGANEDLLQDYEAAGGLDRPRVDAADAVASAMPQSMTILAIYLAVALMLAAVAAAVFGHRLPLLWSTTGAAALALVVVAVLLRQLAVGALGSWMASTNLAEVDTQATTLSGRPVFGAALAVAGSLLGTVATGLGTSKP